MEEVSAMGGCLHVLNCREFAPGVIAVHDELLTRFGGDLYCPGHGNPPCRPHKRIAFCALSSRQRRLCGPCRGSLAAGVSVGRGGEKVRSDESGGAACRERVCQYV